VTVLQCPDNVPLFVVISSSRARYGIMASLPILSISRVIRSGPTDLFFLIDLTLLLCVLISMLKLVVVSPCCINGILSSVLKIV
jgi:hypothetical protein